MLETYSTIQTRLVQSAVTIVAPNRKSILTPAVCMCVYVFCSLHRQHTVTTGIDCHSGGEWNHVKRKGKKKRKKAEASRWSQQPSLVRQINNHQRSPSSLTPVTVVKI